MILLLFLSVMAELSPLYFPDPSPLSPSGTSPIDYHPLPTVEKKVLEAVQQKLQVTESPAQKRLHHQQLVEAWFTNIFNSLQTDTEQWQWLYDALPNLIAEQVTAHGEYMKYRPVVFLDIVNGIVPKERFCPALKLEGISFPEVADVIDRETCVLSRQFPENSNLAGFIFDITSKKTWVEHNYVPSVQLRMRMVVNCCCTLL